MKNLTLLFLSAFFLHVSINLQGQSTFEKIYFVPGGENLSIGYFPNFVHQTLSGDIIIGGARGTGIESSNNFLIRTDEAGDTLWTKTISENGATNIQQTSDSGFIITGYTSSMMNYMFQVLLIKTDYYGDTLWTKTIGHESIWEMKNSAGYCTQQIHDGSFITIGMTSAFGVGEYDIYLMKHDISGNTLWIKTIGNTGGESGYSIKETDDHGFILCCQTNSFGAGSSDVLLVKTDSLGEPEWAKTYGTTGMEVSTNMEICLDQGFVVSGYTQIIGSNDQNIFVLKTDSLGNLLWASEIGNTMQDRGEDIKVIPDGGFVLTGFCQNPADQDKFMVLINLDENGDTLWTKAYGESWSFGNAVYPGINGGFIIAGHTTVDIGYGIYSLPYLVKTDSLGNTGCESNPSWLTLQNASFMEDTASLLLSTGGVILHSSWCFSKPAGLNDSIVCGSTINIEENRKKKRLSAYPNPFSTYTTIQLENSNYTNCKLSIYNSFGQLVRHKDHITSDQIVIEKGDLSRGLYILQVLNQQGQIGVVKLLID
ncbi:MAG: T9SS type A sorting domain-containing protein [Bacteroidales bacterium]|nr:T9SS type A sorting domain-containing protein [Bacteroidales bacterium]MCF8455147.1 T9SS type A sorting domain-containing protein [Bacteroidales bacterium]